MTSDTGPTTDRAAIERAVIDFLEHEILAADVTLDRETDLLSGELLDSMGALRLATFVAEAFAIEVQPADFVVEHFRSVSTVAAFVASVREGRRPGDGRA
jgi:acyl carrier protein